MSYKVAEAHPETGLSASAALTHQAAEKSGPCVRAPASCCQVWGTRPGPQRRTGRFSEHLVSLWLTDPPLSFRANQPDFGILMCKELRRRPWDVISRSGAFETACGISAMHAAKCGETGNRPSEPARTRSGWSPPDVPGPGGHDPHGHSPALSHPGFLLEPEPWGRRGSGGAWRAALTAASKTPTSGLSHRPLGGRDKEASRLPAEFRGGESGG